MRTSARFAAMRGPAHLRVSGLALVALFTVLTAPLAAVRGSAQRNGPLFAANLILGGGDNPDSWCLWVRPLPGAVTRVGHDCPATPPLVSPNGHWVAYVEPLQGMIVRTLVGTPLAWGPRG